MSWNIETDGDLLLSLSYYLISLVGIQFDGYTPEFDPEVSHSYLGCSPKNDAVIFA